MADADDVKVEKIIARAWSDPAFKARLRADTAAELREMGLEPPQGVKVTLIESDDKNAYFVLPPPPADVREGEELRKRASQYDYKALVHVLYNVCCC